MDNYEIPKRPGAQSSNSPDPTTQSLQKELTGSYAEFRQQEYKPLQDKLFAAVYPVLVSSHHVEKISEKLREEFVHLLADRLTSDFFSKSFEFVKKQQKQDAIDIANKQIALKEERIRQARNISLNDFRHRILSTLDGLVKERNDSKKFEIDPFSSKAFELCLTYFHPSSPSKMDRKKGICLVGKVGTGKSTLMAAFQDNPFSSFRIVKAQELVDMYIENPQSTIDKTLSEKPISQEENGYGFNRYDVLIEELGREQLSVVPKGESFKSTPVNVMEKILMELYDTPGIRIHMISNAETPEKLSALYGEAAASRVYEMFNVITLDPKAPNRRFI